MSKGLLIIYLLTYGGSVIALFRPFVGVCLYYFFVILRPQVLWFYATEHHANYSRYVALAALIGWGLKGFPRGCFLKGPLQILWIMASFTLIIRLSAWMAFDPLLSEPIASDMLKIFLMFFVGACILNTIDKLKIFFWLFMISQCYLTIELNIPYFTSGYNAILMGDGFGTLNNNTFALSLLPGVGLSLMSTIYQSHRILRGLSLITFFSSLHLILLSESRGAYLGVIAIVILGLWIIRKNLKVFSIYCVMIFLASFLVGKSVLTEFSTIFADDLDDSATSRYSLWSAAYQVMIDHPWIGVGPMNFGLFSDRFEGLEAGRAAHNLYMQIGADCGFIGLFLLLFFYYKILWKLYQFIQSSTLRTRRIDPIFPTISTGAIIGLAGYLVHSAFSSGLLIETPYVAILMGITSINVFSAEDHVSRT